MAERPKAQGTKGQVTNSSGGVSETPPDEASTLASQGIARLSDLKLPAPLRLFGSHKQIYG